MNPAESVSQQPVKTALVDSESRWRLRRSERDKRAGTVKARFVLILFAGLTPS